VLNLLFHLTHYHPQALLGKEGSSLTEIAYSMHTTAFLLVPTLLVGMQSGRSASRVSHARRGASPRHSHAERGNEQRLRRWSPNLQIWQRRLTLANLVQI